MKKTIATLFALALAAALSGCSDSAFYQDIDPSISLEGVITRAELVDALWNSGEGYMPEAECLAGSSFQIKPSEGFSIKKNPAVSTINPAKTIITSSIEISFTEAEADGRGVSCGPGNLKFTVSASNDDPISIVSAPELKSRHEVDFVAGNIGGTYPKCTISAYFERVGVEVCDPQEEAPDQEPEQEDQEPADDEDDAEEIEEDTPPPAQEQPEEQEEDNGFPILDVVVIINSAPNQNIPFYIYDANPVKCGPEEVRSLRMVVNDFDCTLQEIQPYLFPGQVDPNWK